MALLYGLLNQEPLIGLHHTAIVFRFGPTVPGAYPASQKVTSTSTPSKLFTVTYVILMIVREFLAGSVCHYHHLNSLNWQHYPLIF